MMSGVPLGRRSLLCAAVAALGGCGSPAPPSPRDPSSPPAPSPAPSLAPVPSFDPAPVREVLIENLRPTAANPKHPGYAGAVALVLRDGEQILHLTVGDALRCRAGPVELPAARRVPMRPDTIFDLASLTKIYTAVLTLRL